MPGVSAVPLYQFDRDALGSFEEPQLSADVVHLVAQHGYAVGHEVRGGRLNVVDAEREVIEAVVSQVRRVRTRIGPGGWVELEQLDLEMRIGSFEDEGDVLRFHARHAHVSGGRAAVDRRDVTLFEAKQREELDRRASVCYGDRDVIRIEYHPVAPCHLRRALASACHIAEMADDNRPGQVHHQAQGPAVRARLSPDGTNPITYR